MKEVHLIVVGKLKDKNLEAIEEEYLKRILNPALKIHEVKAQAEDKKAESAEIQKKIKEIAPTGAFLILLAEYGQEFDSPGFATYLNELMNRPKEKLIFVIGGACGHAEDILGLCHAKLSLSPLTFPHKLARILFVEQFYRAQTILRKHPYHN